MEKSYAYKMNLRQRKILYKKAVRKWGLITQLGMLMEEAAELIKATHKVIRSWNKDYSKWNDLAEEIADVEIMIEQIKSVTDWNNLENKVEAFKEKKLLRLKDLVKE
ncbi:hypothetical protein D1BOALGB6SA_5962 [Olavius sp. associated proteobacterium Delta 1]|nr:hypothetical protein D1BOALGB6SA_5962 [Olavius sp. associated proteobacterium Delta 1]